jgi:ATP-dependent RNA helicase RhlE
VFGGVSINPQMMGLRGGADVVVATPGRLLDLVDHNALRLAVAHCWCWTKPTACWTWALPTNCSACWRCCRARRQNLFFSATFPGRCRRWPTAFCTTPCAWPCRRHPCERTRIVQRAIAVDASRRTQLLRHLVKEHDWSRVLVFVATQYAAEHVAEKLYKAGIYATPFHGGLSQGARKQVLQEFKDERWQVVVTTDLAARGIDIAQLPAVVNYDLPRSAVDYVHRIGRTGRAGESGMAVSFVTADMPRRISDCSVICCRHRAA